MNIVLHRLPDLSPYRPARLRALGTFVCSAWQRTKKALSKRVNINLDSALHDRFKAAVAAKMSK